MCLGACASCDNVVVQVSRQRPHSFVYMLLSQTVQQHDW